MADDRLDWFQQSRKSKDNPYRDWYWWRPPRYDADGKRQPPNNWREEFSNGSAWEWDEATQEYYLHLYAKEQPDLNWECAAMRQAVYQDIMKFWLDRGSDGFRMDVINLISKDPRLPDASIQDPNETFQWPYEYCANGPRVHEFLQEMHREVLSHYPGAMTVGETPFTHHAFDVLVPYVLPQNRELNMIFQFEQQEVDGYPPLVHIAYKLSEFKAITARWQTGMQEHGGWNSIYLEVSSMKPRNFLIPHFKTALTESSTEPRRRPLSLSLRRRLYARTPHALSQMPRSDAMHALRHTVHLSRRGDRASQSTRILADRGIRRHRFAGVLSRRARSPSAASRYEGT